MEENKTNLKDLSPEKRQEVIENWNKNRDLLVAQAEVAEARARIMRAQLEELSYTMKINELKNPSPDEQSKSQTGPKEG
jgi:hypothetical protein